MMPFCSTPDFVRLVLESAAPLPKTRRERAAQARAERRARVRAAIRVPAPEPAQDPTAPRPGAWRVRLLSMTGGLVLYAAAATAILATARPVLKTVREAPIEVTFREPPPPPPPVAAPVEAPPPPPPPVAEAMPKPRSRPRPRPEPVVAPEPPADPVEAPPPPPTPTPPRRVVGLNLESTVTGGAGPAFAVGNTRMGETGGTAEDPTGIQRLAPGTPGTPGSGRSNRVAQHVPGGGGGLVRPSRLGKVVPEYPDSLRARGLEADVTVRVHLTPEGRVERVEVLRGAREPAFDAAATTAARRERFAPATNDGTPIAYTIEYTYRFRLDER